MKGPNPNQFHHIYDASGKVMGLVHGANYALDVGQTFYDGVSTVYRRGKDLGRQVVDMTQKVVNDAGLQNFFNS